MKPVDFIVALILLFPFSCDEGPSKTEEFPIAVTGVIVDEASQAPIENVEIIGFHHGVYFGNAFACYGDTVRIGTTDKCGQFNITLPDSIKKVGAHGSFDSTIVMLRLSRPDFGVKHVTIPFQSGTQTLSMGYAPVREAFFRSLYLVQSKDGKSVHIGWNIYSLKYDYYCPSPSCVPCFHTSNGNLYIQRSDTAGIRYVIPIEVDNQQKITDGDLPAGNFNYSIHPGDTGPTYIKADVIRTNYDTLFLIKPPEFPTLNHCN